MGALVTLLKTAPELLSLSSWLDNPFDDTKGLLRSKTAWGAFVPLLVWVASRFGLELPDGDAQAILEQVSLIGGAVLVILGRLDADKPRGRKVTS